MVTVLLLVEVVEELVDAGSVEFVMDVSCDEALMLAPSIESAGIEGVVGWLLTRVPEPIVLNGGVERSVTIVEVLRRYSSH